MSTTTTRRAVLKAGPLLALAPAIALPQETSEIMALFREWYALRRNWPEPGKTAEEDIAIVEAWTDQLDKLAKQIAPLPIVTASDLAAKIVVESSLGDFYLPPSAEMYELVSVTVEEAKPFGQLPRVV